MGHQGDTGKQIDRQQQTGTGRFDLGEKQSPQPKLNKAGRFRSTQCRRRSSLAKATAASDVLFTRTSGSEAGAD